MAREREGSVRAEGRTTHDPRPVRPIRSAGARLSALLLASGAVLAAAALAGAAVTGAAWAEAGIPPSDDLLPPRPPSFRDYGPKFMQPEAGKARSAVDRRMMSAKDPNARMLMEAKELVYDYNREVVTAVGAVDIYYDGRALQADRVAYDQKANWVRATGRVKLTERNGDVIHAESLDITDDFRDGFIQPLRVETTNRTHLAAAKGRRENGQLSVFDRGVYTACELCRDNPDKPPLWQIKAKRIIWREDEKTIYYEDATFELFGQPIAWLPFFSSPDPTVKRKSGVLAPSLARAGDVGYLLETPYFWILSPTSDLTLAPVFSTKQGVMLKGEYRQQLMNGAYSIRAAGISQLDTDEFNGKVPRFDHNGRRNQDGGLTIGPGDKQERWAVTSKGEFDINERWKWGWDVNAVSDKWIRSDYNLWGSRLDATSTLYLTGQGDRSFFELRGYQFYGLTRYDQQDRLPWVAPVVDYDYTFEDPVAGGELSFSLNATSVYREEADFARYRTRLQPRGLAPNTLLSRPDNALVGAEGTYSRISLDAQWRRRFIDPIGQVWTPFAFARGDLIYTDPDEDPRMGPFLDARQDALFRGMAGVGLEYRFPFIAESAMGAHQIEPIAQLILRPNETEVGKLPNEDAQSLLFDETTLFAWNKFSGYDRIEGGSRANVGGQYTFTSTSGSTFNVLAGQSFQISGKNSFEALDATRTGIDTGLDEKSSDYVGGANFAPNKFFSFGSHLRLDDEGFKLRSAEFAARATFDRIQANVIYGRYDDQPLQGYDDIREGVLTGARLFVTPDVYVEGGARYNFDYKVFDRTQIGFGINDIEQCLSLGFSYIREVDNSSESIRVSDTDHKFLVRVDFRTLGSGSFTTRNKSQNEEDMFGSTATRF
jgi:LPS-assembly protein